MALAYCKGFSVHGGSKLFDQLKIEYLETWESDPAPKEFNGSSHIRQHTTLTANPTITNFPRSALIFWALINPSHKY